MVNRGMRTSLDEAMVNLIELLQHLASPSTSTGSKLKSTISQVNSALNNSDSFVRNRHYQCQQECESLSMQISNGEYKLLNLECQLREIAIRQAVLEQSLSEKKYLISEYENKKRNAQSERNGKEAFSFGRAIAGGILSSITFGIALPFVCNYIIAFIIIHLNVRLYHFYILITFLLYSVYFEPG